MRIIRSMTAKDQETVLEMMRTFYASPAVLSNGSDEIFLNDIEACVGDSPYAEGYVFEVGDVELEEFADELVPETDDAGSKVSVDQTTEESQRHAVNIRQIVGYGMLAKSFSTEFGKPCIWIEDLYIKEEFRGLGLGSEFLQMVKDDHPGCVLRLEAEEENERAVEVYHKNDFKEIPYMELIWGN